MANGGAAFCQPKLYLRFDRDHGEGDAKFDRAVLVRVNWKRKCENCLCQQNMCLAHPCFIYCIDKYYTVSTCEHLQVIARARKQLHQSISSIPKKFAEAVMIHINTYNP